MRENNQAAGKTWTWQYDNAGNIINRKEYAYTTATGVQADRTYTYTYPDPTDPEDSDWGDLLQSYDGRSYTYDGIGNPLSDGKRTYTWRNGREMHSVSQNGTTWFMAYNADGLRTKRVSTGTAYAYYYSGSSLRQMYIGSTGLYFRYDTNGTPVSVTYGGAIYYYITNLQGDVTALVNANGEEVVSYIYDAWGNILDIDGSLKDTLGKHNPLRYRGYVYDEETGLYYLQSRYYDPEIGRFINADAAIGQIGNVQGNNMFAYAFNNPVAYSDSTGNWPKLSGFFLGIAVAATVAGQGTVLCLDAPTSPK